jgi:cell division protein FtsB
MARRRASARRTNLRRVVLLLGVALVGYLYYHPLRSYFDTKHELAGRSAEVHVLQAQKRKLERQLHESGTPQALAREARMQLSLVKPGEQLFIVKGIDAWRRAQHPAK